MADFRQNGKIMIFTLVDSLYFVVLGGIACAILDVSLPRTGLARQVLWIQIYLIGIGAGYSLYGYLVQHGVIIC